MTRTIVAAAFLAAFAPKMPEGCNKLLGKTTVTSATADAPPPAPKPVPTPSTAVTTPPIWTPPEPPMSATPAATVDPYANDSTAAKTAYDKHEWKKVRSALDRKVKAGKATPDDVTMMKEACERLKDKSCLETLRKQYPPSAEYE